MNESSSKIFYQFKIILLGDSGVGKTSLLGRYMDEEFISNKPCTINADFKIKSIALDQNSSAQITIWDTCGQERYRAMTRQYFKDAHGIILIYDIADKRSFSNLSIWLEEIKKNNGKDDISIILVGNKIDLKFRNVNKEDAENFAKNNNITYCEVSCKDGINIDNVFDTVIKDIIIKLNNNKSISDYNMILSPSNSVKAVSGREKKEKRKSFVVNGF